MQITEAAAPPRIRHSKYPLLQVTLQSAFPLPPFSPDLSGSTKTCYCCLLLLCLLLLTLTDSGKAGLSRDTSFPQGKGEAFEAETGPVGAEFKALPNG